VAASEAALGLAGLPSRQDVENVVVLGMGGSGAAGDVVLAVAGPFMPVPVVVVKSYAPPAFVGRGTLVFAVSFSGDTEETVEAAMEAESDGAAVVVITRGGELARLARSWGAPMVEVPPSIPVPRAALAAMAVPALVVLEEVGLFPGATRWIELAVDQLRRRRDQLVGGASLAASLARRIGRTFPLVHSSGALGAAAAQRWKTQINENAKAPAFWSVHPELCHNEIVGWGQHGDLTRQLFTVVNLRHEAEHPQVARRFALAAEILGEVVAGVEQVEAEGEGPLAQLLDLVLIGDFVSLHLAAQEGIDPGPTPVLDDIKAALRQA
ncbi:MAG TPA: SIS domain-containing protein, partial [Acidimicrobiales bacterium]|nr:SIS domain-containing protein [Acidimicrobiales bacterium]